MSNKCCSVSRNAPDSSEEEQNLWATSCFYTVSRVPIYRSRKVTRR